MGASTLAIGVIERNCHVVVMGDLNATETALDSSSDHRQHTLSTLLGLVKRHTDQQRLVRAIQRQQGNRGYSRLEPDNRAAGSLIDRILVLEPRLCSQLTTVAQCEDWES